MPAARVIPGVRTIQTVDRIGRGAQTRIDTRSPCVSGRAMSRSVMTPSNWPASCTTTAPMSLSRISWAAAAIEHHAPAGRRPVGPIWSEVPRWTSRGTATTCWPTCDRPRPGRRTGGCAGPDSACCSRSSCWARSGCSEYTAARRRRRATGTRWPSPTRRAHAPGSTYRCGSGCTETGPSATTSPSPSAPTTSACSSPKALPGRGQLDRRRPVRLLHVQPAGG